MLFGLTFLKRKVDNRQNLYQHHCARLNFGNFCMSSKWDKYYASPNGGHVNFRARPMYGRAAFGPIRGMRHGIYFEKNFKSETI